MKNEYGWEKIEIPHNLEEKIKDAVKLGKSKKRQMIGRRIGYSCAGIAAALVLCFIMGFKFPMIANAMAKVPVIGNVFSYLYNLEAYEGKYTQVAEDAKPAERPEQEGDMFGGSENAGEMAVEPDNTDEVKVEESLVDSAVQNPVTTSDQGVTITITEYYCDKNSMYLALEVSCDEAVFNAVTPYTEGAVQFYMTDSLELDSAETLAGSGDGLLAEGIYLNANTFIGIARVDIAMVAEENNVEIPDTFTYTISGKHIKAYGMELGVIYDVRGLWEMNVEVTCDSEELQILPVNAFAENGCGIVDVRVTEYEVQVSVLADDTPVWVVVFDQNGKLLENAGDTLNAFEGNCEVWKFAGKENLQTLYIYVVEEAKWLDEWKGQLYDGVLTGNEMMELLAEKALISAEVKVQ